MEKFDKTNLIVIAVAALLVLVLIIVMICGACSGKKDTNWNPLTSGSTTDTTGNTTSDSTQDSTQNQTDGTAGTGPQVNVGVVDRNEIDNVLNQPTSGTKPTTPTTPTTGGTTGTTNSQPTTKPTEKPKPSETTNPTETTGAATNPETTTPTEELELLTYEEWNALSRAEKIAYRKTFPSLDDYYQWYDAAKAQYDSTRPITDGNIDLGGGN